MRKPNDAFGGRSALDRALGGKVVDGTRIDRWLRIGEQRRRPVP